MVCRGSYFSPPVIFITELDDRSFLEYTEDVSGNPELLGQLYKNILICILGIILLPVLAIALLPFEGSEGMIGWLLVNLWMYCFVFFSIDLMHLLILFTRFVNLPERVVDIDMDMDWIHNQRWQRIEGPPNEEQEDNDNENNEN